MNFHETVRGQRFFDVQLPKLISSLSEVAEQMKTPHPTIPVETTEDTQELLVQLYYSTFDREAAPDREIHDRFNQAISQMQAEIKDEVGSELWQKIEHTYATIATRTASEREQAYAAGFRTAMRMVICGLTQPKPNGNGGI